MEYRQSHHSSLDEYLRSNIQDGTWPVGGKIPTEVELAARFSISRGTVRTIIMQLVGEGLLYRVQGSGTFVSAPRTAMPFRNINLRAQMDVLLHIFVVRVVRAELVCPPEWVAELLGVAPTSKVFYMERARYRSVPDSTPCIYQYDWMRPELGEGLDLSALVLGRLATQIKSVHGLEPVRIREWVEAAGATALEAKELKISVGAPVMIMEELAFDREDKPYMFTRFTMLPTLMKLEFG